MEIILRPVSRSPLSRQKIASIISYGAPLGDTLDLQHTDVCRSNDVSAVRSAAKLNKTE